MLTTLSIYPGLWARSRVKAEAFSVDEMVAALGELVVEGTPMCR